MKKHIGTVWINIVMLLALTTCVQYEHFIGQIEDEK